MGDVTAGATKAEYSWSDLFDKVADLRAERDKLLEEAEGAKVSECQQKDELLEALGGKRARADEG